MSKVMHAKGPGLEFYAEIPHKDLDELLNGVIKTAHAVNWLKTMSYKINVSARGQHVQVMFTW